MFGLCLMLETPILIKTCGSTILENAPYVNFSYGDVLPTLVQKEHFYVIGSNAPDL